MMPRLFTVSRTPCLVKASEKVKEAKIKKKKEKKKEPAEPKKKQRKRVTEKVCLFAKISQLSPTSSDINNVNVSISHKDNTRGD